MQYHDALMIIDPGSFSTKVGYSGEKDPPSIYQSIAGIEDTNEFERQNDTDKPKKNYSFEDNFKVRRPRTNIVRYVKNGLVTDYFLFEKSLFYTFQTRLNTNLLDQNLFFTDTPLADYNYRQELIKHAFEEMKARKFFVSNSAMLSAFSLGRSDCIVVDCGHDRTFVSPLVNGYADPKMIEYSPFAGSFLANELLNYINSTSSKISLSFFNLKKTGSTDKMPDVDEIQASYYKHNELEVVRDIKERHFSIQDDRSNDYASPKYEMYNIDLPDGKSFDLNINRHLIPEKLFMQEPNHPEFKGIHHMVINGMKNISDKGLRKQLFSQIVVCGGTSIIPGFSEKLQRLIQQELLMESMKIRITNPYNLNDSIRKSNSWTGASIIASLSTFKDMLITKQEYEEFGSSVVIRKCA